MVKHLKSNIGKFFSWDNKWKFLGDELNQRLRFRIATSYAVTCKKGINEKDDFLQRYKYYKDWCPDYIVMFDDDDTVINEIKVVRSDRELMPNFARKKVAIYSVNIPGSMEKSINDNLKNLNRSASEVFRKQREGLGGVRSPNDDRKIIDKGLECDWGLKNFEGEVYRPMVFVDKTEFSSDLPADLYYAGFKVIPKKLDIGDYILTDNVIVERKSVRTGDLVGSLRNKRLETQLAKMKSVEGGLPILLVEIGSKYDLKSQSDKLKRHPKDKNGSISQEVHRLQSNHYG
jgi:hypothetical protein